MVALHEALRTICPNTEWTYSVFWSIRPRPRVRGGGNSCKVGDDNGSFGQDFSLMLMWEDGYCRGRGGSGDCYGEIEGVDPVRKSFRKMSNQLYNYGEGLMGKVASDKCHKWVFMEQNESESNASSYWQSSFDAIKWNDQFESGIQTIAVIQAGHGLLQLGSCKIENLHFVTSQASTSLSSSPQTKAFLLQIHPSWSPTTPFFLHRLNHCWNGTSQRPMMAQSSLPTHHTHMPFPVMPNSSKEQDSDVKWPTGLSFFNALTNNVNVKLLFDSEGLGDKPEHQSQEHRNNSESQANSKPAVTAILINCQKLVVANVGDSRAVICKDGVAKQLSDYHGPNMEKGVIERGGFVEMLLEWMVNWLWQGHLVMSNQEAVDSIKGTKDAKSAAMHLAEAQMISQWSSLSFSKLGSI
ncbi:BnaC01g36300D [Brassica napus]|uniref:BnaC01g36300D protein n=1 Tax=Brassica napus TaxID=3708 RepID=A0A078H3B6_BRANA|nr:BnaC01g36300D [Brassica napus]